MTPKVWAVALLSLVSVPALFPDGAFAQGLTAGQCFVFGERGLLDDATRQACCRVHNMWCTIPTFGGGAGTGQSVAGGAASGAAGGGGNTVGDAQSAVDALNALRGGRSSPTGPGASQGSNDDRNADTSTAGAAQSVVDALNALNAGRSSPTGPGASQGSSGDRNANTRTPEQDSAVKTTPYFFEDRSKYQQ